MPTDASRSATARTAARARAARIGLAVSGAERPGQLPELLHPLGSVEGHDVRHESADAGAVRGVGQCADRILQGMGGGRSRGAEGEAAREGGPHHAGSRLEVVRRVAGASQMRCHCADGLEGEQVGQHVRADEDALARELRRRGSAYRGEGLDAVGEGVGARGGRDGPRAGDRQHGVADRDGRDEVGTRDADLDRPVRVGDDRDRGDLGAGARGRGHRDHRCDGSGHETLAVVVGRPTAVREQERQDLGEVEAAPAAEAHDDVRVVIARHGRGHRHLLHRQLRCGLVEDADGDAGAGEAVDQFAKTGSGGQMRVGDDESPPAETLHDGRQDLTLADAEEDLAGAAEQAEAARHRRSRRRALGRADVVAVQGEEVEVRPGVLADADRFLLRQRTAHLRRHPRDQGAGRDHGALPDDRPRRDEGAPADAGAGEHDGSHADQAAVLDETAVEDGAMTDRDALPQDHVAVLVRVRDAAVLDVAPRAHRDGAAVRAQHAAVPDARLRPEAHVADEHRTGGDPGPGSQLRRAFPERQQHGVRGSRRAAGTGASSRYHLLAVPPVTSARSPRPAPAATTASDRSLQASAYVVRRQDDRPVAREHQPGGPEVVEDVGHVRAEYLRLPRGPGGERVDPDGDLQRDARTGRQFRHLLRPGIPPAGVQRGAGEMVDHQAQVRHRAGEPEDRRDLLGCDRDDVPHQAVGREVPEERDHVGLPEPLQRVAPDERAEPAPRVVPARSSSRRAAVGSWIGSQPTIPATVDASRAYAARRSFSAASSTDCISTVASTPHLLQLRGEVLRPVVPGDGAVSGRSPRGLVGLTHPPVVLVRVDPAAGGAHAQRPSHWGLR